MSSLKKKFIEGLFWSGAERILVQAVQLCILMILARILDPRDFGIIGMLSVFIAVSQSLIDSGFSKALIRKKHRSESDFATIFYFNVFVSFSLYILLFLLAPTISNFFSLPILRPIVRLISLNLIINSFTIIHRTQLSIAVDFKTLTKASLYSMIIGGGIGIYFSTLNLGPWALAWQSVSTNIVLSLYLWKVVPWRPKEFFSFPTFNGLFKFGAYLSIAGFIYTLFEHIYNVIIGKYYDAVNVGYYDKVKNIAQLPSLTLGYVIQRVTFPIFSDIQDEPDRLLHNYRITIKATAFIIFPTMLFFFVLAHPIIYIVLSKKWLPAVPIFQLICFVVIWFPIDELNVNLINLSGNSLLVMKLEIVKKIIIIFMIFCTIHHGIRFLLIGQIFSAFCNAILNMIYGGKTIKYSLKNQLLDIFPYLFFSLVVGLFCFYTVSFISFSLLKIVYVVVIGFSLYLGICFLCKPNDLKIILGVVKQNEVYRFLSSAISSGS